MLGLCIATREAIQDMERRGVAGHVVHVSSMAGHRVPGRTPPCTRRPSSPSARSPRGSARSCAAREPIRVTSVSPGYVDTEFAAVFPARRSAGEAHEGSRSSSRRTSRRRSSGSHPAAARRGARRARAPDGAEELSAWNYALSCATRRRSTSTIREDCGSDGSDGRCGATGREAPTSRLSTFPAADAIDGRPRRRIARGERLLRCFLDDVIRRRLRRRRWCLAFHAPSIRSGRAASIPRGWPFRPRAAAARAAVAAPRAPPCDRAPTRRRD